MSNSSESTTTRGRKQSLKQRLSFPNLCCIADPSAVKKDRPSQAVPPLPANMAQVTAASSVVLIAGPIASASVLKMMNTKLDIYLETPRAQTVQSGVTPLSVPPDHKRRRSPSPCHLSQKVPFPANQGAIPPVPALPHSVKSKSQQSSRGKAEADKPCVPGAPNFVF